MKKPFVNSKFKIKVQRLAESSYRVSFSDGLFYYSSVVSEVSVEYFGFDKPEYDFSKFGFKV